MRNIIICCDGTGNEISENISNVLKLYRCLRKTEKTQPRQLVYYDPGVGTLARPDRGTSSSRVSTRSSVLYGLRNSNIYAVSYTHLTLPTILRV